MSLSKNTKFISLLLSFILLMPTFAYASNEEDLEVCSSTPVSEDLSEASEDNAPIESALKIDIIEIDEPAIEDAPVINEGGSELPPFEGTLSDALPKNISVNDITVGPSPANSNYSCISFIFSSDESSSKYECYITGFKTDAGSEYSSTTKDYYASLCMDIAKSYYKGEKFRISDDQSFKDKYSLSLRPIDAEKDNLEAPDFGEKPTEEIQDGGLCWAAASSNILEYTGWADKASEQNPDVEGVFDNEDTLFTYYTGKFFNRGLNSAAGVRFFIDGINTEQSAFDGQIAYDFDNTRCAQVKKEGENGYLKQYCADDIVTAKYIYGPDATDSLDDIAYDVELLKSGYGMGLGFNGHATTLFGYIKDTVKSGIESLRAVFIADSDNDVEVTPKIDKKDKPNSITMYTNISRATTGEESEDAIGFTNWSLIKPYSDSVPEDRSGMMDSQKNSDLSSVETYVVTNDEYKKRTESRNLGEQITLDAKIANYSYVKLDYSRSPVLKGSYVVYVNGSVADTLPVEYNFQKYDCDPNAKIQFMLKTPYTLKYEGDYEIAFVIDGVYYSDGSRLDESYYSNNTSKKNARFTVAQNHESSMLIFNKSEDTSLKYRFFCPTDDFKVLYIDGHVIDTSLYEIKALGNNMYEIEIFSKALTELSEGNHKAEITNSQNETVLTFYFIIQN